MRAPLALSLLVGLLLASATLADDPPKKTAPATPATPPQSKPEPAKPVVAQATPAEAKQASMGLGARLSALQGPEAKDKPGTKAIIEVLTERQRLLAEWEKLTEARAKAEHPEKSPEHEAAETRADLEKTKAVLDQSAKNPDLLVPEAFQADANATTKPIEARLTEMKEAIDAARVEFKERSTELETLKGEGTRSLAAKLATLRADRDKVHQVNAAMAGRRSEREANVNSAASGEARELATDRLVNFDWECRVESQRLALMEVQIALEVQRLDLVALQVQARSAHVQLAKRIVDRMENRYAALAERQRTELKRAVVKEENRAAKSGDPLERFRAKRTADLLELESQVVALEKADATTTGLSLPEQKGLADAAVVDFAELKKTFDDGNVSPLDVLRLKNDFRRIVPERAQIVRTDLAESDAELISYENALTDAEIDLVNDSRDDRFDREALLEQVPQNRRFEAKSILEDLEGRHKTLLDRRRNVLRKLAQRAEAIHEQVTRRIGILDEQYAFVRTHIFWVRDAEPLGVATVAHARDESVRAAKAVVHLGLEAGDRSLWSRPSPEFFAAILLLAAIPWPIHLGLVALDRYRLAVSPPAATAVVEDEATGIDG